MISYDEAFNLIKEKCSNEMVIIASRELEDCYIFTVGNKYYNDTNSEGNADDFSIFKEDGRIERIDMQLFYEIFDPPKAEMGNKTLKKLV